MNKRSAHSESQPSKGIASTPMDPRRQLQRPCLDPWGFPKIRGTFKGVIVIIYCRGYIGVGIYGV